ncbi:IS5 family transposase (plasmid) [Lichenicola cladoniae]|uniref:IS5 family transposase n=1 Tax=Lichenicola cladoniae TaxID=1484109 RepID=A0A6M8HZ90_9PROT|nr:IS5 family transposase [Lichenicola cladoniae]NPD67825.1 IS5 family transposase [Acetobacteraceae bacterium]QKE93576.1 IS5 family transposase [Lichenicola cladoniae]
MPFKHNASRRHHIPKACRRVMNWPAYEAGLRQRGDLTLWLDEAALTGWHAPRRTTRGGQPIYAEVAIELVLTLRLVFHLALRQAEGFARSVLRLLGLDLCVPDHSTLSRRGRAFAGRQPRAARRDEPVHVVLDSTGLQVFGQGEWDAEKHGRTPRQWRKLHLAVNVETGEIVAHSLTDKDTGDISEGAVLLATVEGQIASVIADGAYDGASVYDAAAARRHNPPPHIVIPPRASSIVKADAEVETVRDRHVRDIAEKGRMAWQKANGYGRRSIVETTIGRYKHIIGSKLRARSTAGQKAEVAIAICALNQMIRIAKPLSAPPSDAITG